MYKAPPIQKPGLDELQQIAADLQLKISEDDISVYHELIGELLEANYPVLEKYVEPVLPVKYPRTPGYRPSQEENKYNAWYYKSTIDGATSGPLKGYKIVIKDNIPVAGVPMMHGSRVMEGYVPDYDPTVVTRLLDAGATIVGKATCEDFCFSGNSFTSHPAPVLNPHDITRSSGGSSSGCAVLVQTGEADMALGADQGGSIRIPACWTGIVGMKPTFGLVPYTGIGSMSPSTDNCGPMTRTVKECALMLEAMAGDDEGLDMRQRNTPPPEKIPKYSQLLSSDLTGIKIGLVQEGFPSTELAPIVRGAAKRLEEKGAVVEEMSIPIHSDGSPLWFMTFVEGGYHTMIKAQGYPVGAPSYYATSSIDSSFAGLKAHARDIPESVKVVELLGSYVADNYGMHYYAKSQNLCRLMKQKYDEALENYDILVMPTIKYEAPKLPDQSLAMKDRIHSALSMAGNTAPFNATGHPALSITAGFHGGLPVGMMLIGKHMEDQMVLNAAFAYEQIRDANK